MASVVAICNVGLRLLGANTITAIDEGTKNADLCQDLWDDVLDAVLRDHPWNCAMERAQLSADVTGPLYEWGYSYTLPTDPYCLRVLGTSNDEYVDDNGAPMYPYVIEGRKILTDVSELYIKYTGRITDPNDFDSLIKNALSKAMAKELAYPITKSLQTLQAMTNLYGDAIMRAKQVDAQEGDNDVLEANVLWNVRH